MARRPGDSARRESTRRDATRFGSTLGSTRRDATRCLQLEDVVVVVIDVIVGARGAAPPALALLHCAVVVGVGVRVLHQDVVKRESLLALRLLLLFRSSCIRILLAASTGGGGSGGVPGRRRSRRGRRRCSGRGKGSICVHIQRPLPLLQRRLSLQRWRLLLRWLLVGGGARLGL